MVAVREPTTCDDAEEREAVRRVPSRDEINAYHLIDETRLVGGLIERAVYTEDERRKTSDIARRLVKNARVNQKNHGGVDAFMQEYGLSSEEGVLLMCIAEALLRIPDSETASQLIAEKLADGAWHEHIGHSDSLLVNASTWGMLLTGRLVKLKDDVDGKPLQIMKRLMVRTGEPVIREALRQAVKILGDQFVLGRTISEALSRAAALERRGYLFSYDMLGEAARTEADAERYFDRYMEALLAVGRAAGPLATEHPDALMRRPGLSVKLSAIHSRFEAGKERRLQHEMMPRLMELLRAAREQGLTITIDAEEQDRLDVMLTMFADAYRQPALEGWHGLGLAVQAYGKRAIPILRWLRRLSEQYGRRIPVRLVKGAYWDSEIKWAQERGLADYPVFTRKLHTDVSYLACMRLLLSDRRAFYPQLATHNAHTLAAGFISAGDATFEFQRLHGMGEALHEQVVSADELNRRCRIYAPVGGHEDLLAYLVRRLLENGANASFVNRLADDELPIDEIVRDPVARAEDERAAGGVEIRDPIRKPAHVFSEERIGSAGLALSDSSVRDVLEDEMIASIDRDFEVGPIVCGETDINGDGVHWAICPHDRRERIGTVAVGGDRHIETALDAAVAASHTWDRTEAEKRAEILELAARLFERDRSRLMAVIVREAGKTVQAAHDDVREAVDFLRYYAFEARCLFSVSQDLPGPTGERNTLRLCGRGPFVCISPWNFPLAIFTGQVAAALAAGNTVLAKPAEQTPIVACFATKLLHEAGVPRDVLHLLPGTGDVGAALVRDRRIKGVVFTGSNETAWAIQRSLADRGGDLVPFIAETGGINAMIVDSTALPEQVVRDCVRSAFDSAGQRCSAARVLFVQKEIAPRILPMLAGAVEALDLGDPLDFSTDIGPVIDGRAQDFLDGHKLRMLQEGREIIDVELPDSCRVGTYVTPAIYEIDRLDVLDGEIFGPVLHVIRYERAALDKVVEAINSSGYGLTLGLHSRIGAIADYIETHVRVGNFYVNRNQIGAVVGSQPFGGEGLSGTGPKAGGPNYLTRFATERVRTTDITATGGNLQLLRRGTQGVS